MNALLGFCFLTFVGTGYAAEIGFVSRTGPNGKPVRLENNGRFIHAAIRYRGQWLHARPFQGVVLSSSLGDIGTVTAVLSNPAVPEPTDAFVSQSLNLPYSFVSLWDDPTTSNCSKFLGRLLGITPKPMTFDPEIWGEQYQKFRGELGLSPDELYRALHSEREYVRINPRRCRYQL